MKNINTPRTLSECEFVTGYASVRPMAYREPQWEKLAGYALAVAIGVGLAAVLFFGWSA